MFYCEACRLKKAWPESLVKSVGPCELCGTVAKCYDRPSDSLPDPDSRYRYTLIREFITGVGDCLWVMLNPSTADHIQDDPTIRRCTDFTRRWGFRRLLVVNLYAFRATDPKHLEAMGWPTGGKRNNLHIAAMARTADRIILAWGTHGDANGRGHQVTRMIVKQSKKHQPAPALLCLGVNKGGSSKHPLYVKADTDPIPYPLAPAYWQNCCEETLDRIEEAREEGQVEIITRFPCDACQVTWNLTPDGKGNDVFQPEWGRLP